MPLSDEELGSVSTVARPGDLVSAKVAGQSQEYPRGTAIDRYLVLSRLGSGGMGVVYAAYDGDLSRKVALKMLHTDRDPSGALAEALRREAQALARVSHPNVVAVYDVGTFQAEVYLVMELVDGVTLREWFDLQPRDWRDVVRCLVGAGRGLEAVHQRGLAHQDFKPANVLVDGSGTARVSDFGLARVAGTLTESDSRPLPGPTLMGGTPGYMAPEQWQGHAADARADQFAFCVALYEGLYRELPFGRASLAGQQTLDVRAPAVAANVPSWVRRVILRGLSARPEDRFASMSALLDALGTDPSTARWQTARRAGIALVVLAVAAYYPALRLWKHQACVRDAGQRVDWSNDRIAGLRNGFKAENPRVEALLARHATRLEAELVTACDATQTDVLTCLGRRTAELQALSALFTRVGSEVADKALLAIDGLSSPESCRAPDVVEKPIHPDEPLRLKLAQGKVLQLSGRNEEAAPIIKAVVDAAGEDLDASAEGLLLMGQTQLELSKPADAKKTFALAVNAAERAGHSELAASAWIRLAYVTGFGLDQYDEALADFEHARAILEHLGKPALLTASFERNSGHVLQRAGKFDDAAAAYQRAIAIGEATEPGLDVANALTGLTGALRQAGKVDEALKTAQRALAIREKLLGPDHLEVAITRNALGNVFHDLGDIEGAAAQFQKSAELFEKAQGPRSQRVAFALSNQGNCLSELGRHDEAFALLERSLKIREEVLGKTHSEAAISHNSIGSAEMRRGHWAAARASFERALAIHSTRGPEHPSVINTLINLASAQTSQRHADEALATLEKAKAGAQKLPTGLGRYEAAVGTALLAQGKPTDALPHFDKALTADKKLSPSVALEAQLGRGRVLEGAEAITALEAALASVKSGVVDMPELLADAQLALAERIEKADAARASHLADLSRGFYAAAEDRAAETARAVALIARVKP